jgi:hypothetical protein
MLRRFRLPFVFRLPQAPRQRAAGRGPARPVGLALAAWLLASGIWALGAAHVAAQDGTAAQTQAQDPAGAAGGAAGETAGGDDSENDERPDAAAVTRAKACSAPGPSAADLATLTNAEEERPITLHFSDAVEPGAPDDRLRLLPDGRPVVLKVLGADADEVETPVLRVFAVKSGEPTVYTLSTYGRMADATTNELELVVRAETLDWERWWPWPMYRLYLVGCDRIGGTTTLVATTTANVSFEAFCAFVAVVLVVLAYLAMGLVFNAGRRAAWERDKALPGSDDLPEPTSRWGPVSMTAGVDGRGSISRLQILFFTLIVAGLLVFVLLRIGYLGELSESVLYLLGIAGAGTLAAKQTSVVRRRLDPQNWAWLLRTGWRPPKHEPGVADLVMENGEFDIYRFQILVFSFIVGLSLLFTGLFGLATFELPDSMLVLLGLSQAVYVGGKAVTKPQVNELNKQIGDFRDSLRELRVQDPGATALTPELKSQADDIERLLNATYGRAKAESVQPATPELKDRAPGDLA